MPIFHSSISNPLHHHHRYGITMISTSRGAHMQGSSNYSPTMHIQDKSCKSMEKGPPLRTTTTKFFFHGSGSRSSLLFCIPFLKTPIANWDFALYHVRSTHNEKIYFLKNLLTQVINMEFCLIEQQLYLTPCLMHNSLISKKNGGNCHFYLNFLQMGNTFHDFCFPPPENCHLKIESLSLVSLNYAMPGM